MLMAAAPALAQSLTTEQVTILERLTISATRTTKNVLDVPMTVSVITSKDLKKHVVRDIQDLVRYEPGVSVDRTTSLTNPWGQLNSFRIRGASGNRVQMIVDGSRVQEQIIDGSRDFVDPANMKSIEIARGPNSVLWGSDALGGTVVFRTKDPSDLLDGEDKPWAVEVSTSFDTLDKSWRKQVTAAYDFGDVQVLGSFGQRSANEVSLSNARADGGIYGCPRYNIMPCNLLNPADISALNGLAKVVWTPNADHKVTLTGEAYDSFTRVNQIYDSSATTGPLSPTAYRNNGYIRDLNMRRYRIAIDHEWQVRTPWLDSITWHLSFSPQQRRTVSDQSRIYSNRTDQVHQVRDFTEQFLEGDVQLTSTADIGETFHTFTYGFDGDLTQSHYEGTTGTTPSNTGVTTTTYNQGFAFPNTTTRRADVYLQDEIKLFQERLTVTPGVRLSSYSLDPTKDTSFPTNAGFKPKLMEALNFTKKLGVIYKLDDSYSVYASYGEGFKMPTAQLLYYSTPDGQVIPNPNLRPESSFGYEAGVRGEFENGYFSVGGFYSEYTDFISTLQDVPGSPGKYTSLNISNVKLWGIEASAEYEFYENIFATGSLTWQRGTQVATAGAATTAYDGATPLTAVLGLRYEIPENGLEFEVIGTFAAGPTERASATAFKPEGYAVFDAFATWKPTDKVEVNFGVQNIFDTRYFPNTLTNYSMTASTAVANQNPLEMQVAPGRTFKIGTTVKF
jgi:hemoglobin/transferrin/lactoferrin receptor protein